MHSFSMEQYDLRLVDGSDLEESVDFRAWCRDAPQAHLTQWLSYSISMSRMRTLLVPG